MKAILVLLILVASAGCNLSVNVIDNPPPLPSPTQSNAIVEHPTNRPPTTTPLPPTATTVPPTAAPTCTPHTDWPIYRVAVGDTLGQIAVRTGSSTAALIQANCLTNANLISVGQTLHVPRQPTPPTAVPPTAIPTTAVQHLGTISVSPTITGDAGNFALLGGATITIKWDGGPADAIRTDFYQRTFDGSMTFMGTDTNSADGLSITWIAQLNFEGTITASALRSDGSTVTPFFTPAVYVNDPYSPANAITLNTYLRVEGDTYFVKPNQPTVLTWAASLHLNQQLDFKFSPADHTKQPYLLGSDPTMLDGASITVTFAPSDFGVVSAEVFYPDGSRSTFAKPITISAAVVEATAEATVEAK